MKQPLINVLIVDDDPGIRDLLATVLTRLFPHCVVRTVGSATAAFEMLKHQPFDLLITDQRMDDVTGLDLAAHTRAMGHTMPILLITGLEEFEADVWASGITATLVKPFQVTELRSLVRSLIPGAWQAAGGSDAN